MTAYLGEVCRLELQGNLHQRVRNVSAASSETACSGDCAERLRVIVVAPGLLFNLVLHAEALAFDDDGVGVMQDAVQDGRGQGAVVVEDL